MEQKVVVKTLAVEGMTCPNCEMRIENKLKKLPGIVYAEAKYENETVRLTFDSTQVSLSEIAEAVESLDYVVKSTDQQKNKTTEENISNKKPDVSFLLGVGLIIFALYFMIQNTIGFNFIPEVNQNMGYGILWIVGMLTSLHCIAMCGGLNLSQCVSYKTNRDNKISKLKPSLLYNAGRVVSYTAIGGIVGAVGSVVSLSGTAKGFVSIFAGILMFLMGLNLLNIFPRLRKLMPRMPKILGNKVYNNKEKYGPFYVGLLNGFMPCGPLQSMQIYALGTGSFMAGALSMFMFSLGTVPLMFGFGAIGSLLSGKFTHKMMKVSACLVMVLGIVMLNRGLSLSGIDVFAFVSPVGNGAATDANTATVSSDIQYITTKMTNGRYTPITVQRGIPVKWTIQAEKTDLNGCNNAIQIPKYGIQLKLKPGDNIVEFTPEESGIVPYSCWMGMIRSKITVVDDLGQAQDDPRSETDIWDGNQGLSDSMYGENGIPTDNIQAAALVNGIQDITITVSNKGFLPAVIVLQKDKEFIIRFKVDPQDGYDGIVYFPEYQGGLDLTQDTETPTLTAPGDFTFEDEYGSFRGYAKVVDDVNNIDIQSIQNDVKNYMPVYGSSGGASCH